jgi:hypothetical protein
MKNPENETTLFRTVCAHEFFRCREAFDSFRYLMVTLPENDTKRWRLNCYNTYVDFLSHLYEFYLGFIERGSQLKQQGLYNKYPPFKDKKEYEKIDIIFNEEVAKLFRNGKDRLINGYKDTLGYREDFYSCEIPKKFGEHFRHMRNRRNHTNFKRASNDFDISLKDFFETYHKFIVILYEESRWLWQVDENEFEWEAIDDFASEIFK